MVFPVLVSNESQLCSAHCINFLCLLSFPEISPSISYNIWPLHKALHYPHNEPSHHPSAMLQAGQPSCCTLRPANNYSAVPLQCGQFSPKSSQSCFQNSDAYSDSLQWCMHYQYLVILDCVITALDCITLCWQWTGMTGKTMRLSLIMENTIFLFCNILYVAYFISIFESL